MTRQLQVGIATTALAVALGILSSNVCAQSTGSPQTVDALNQEEAALQQRLQRLEQEQRIEALRARVRQLETKRLHPSEPRIASAAAEPIPARRASGTTSKTDVFGAYAADMPVKSPYLQPAPAFSWSGFYAGLHLGYGWGSNNWNFGGFIEQPTIAGQSQNVKTNGVLGGVQAGANYQIASWVFGMEAEWAFMDGKGSADATIFQPNFPLTSTATSRIDWLAMFTGRVGYAVDRTLFYVKGGVAAAEFKDNYAITTTVPPINIVDFGTKTNTDVGWIAGGGIEHAFTPHWSGKIEYNYVDLGTTSEKFNVVGPGASVTVREDIHHKLQIVKVGANYKFD